jgi:Xaa-Pro aminopeptidase
MAATGLSNRAVLVDEATVPKGLATVAGRRPRAAPTLGMLIAVKTPSEIARIEGAVRLCDAGHREARLSGLAGTPEVRLWSRLRASVDAEAGEPAPLIGDVLTGPRTRLIGGPATDRLLGSGEPILVDLSARRFGMWADSCATWSLGDPAREFTEAFQVVEAALDAALSALAPGVVAGDLDTSVREELGRAGFTCPHHIGHGVGFSVHEEPRIVPGASAQLTPGMVVALEPGIYTQDFGVRIERVAVITEAGHRVVSGHDTSYM